MYINVLFAYIRLGRDMVAEASDFRRALSVMFVACANICMCIYVYIYPKP